ncbi:YicC family protein [Marinicella sp. S1101]|uniref:YicC/YloC family endoribonuclease n=1 Tax=Marinicella marina TaxID=2996016 RepID=UPI002260BDFC|nr:YicC/YloC family endoribonuclease [Marinicella marina]MCX7552932.1 YicC family protein [Marinicella marina]MDJ1139759.1 YicC/YloC family endoribonuclease [Marinicella marina]
MHSMTAFAAHEVVSDLGKLSCEIKTVNQRFLDLTIKAPEFLRPLENQFRKLFNQHLSRGKVSVFIRFFPNESVSLTQLNVNKALLSQLVDQANQISNEHGLSQTMGTAELMTWPEVMIQQPTDLSVLNQTAIELINTSIERLKESRLREGQAMYDVLSEKANSMATLTQDIRTEVPAINEFLANKLRTKLADLDVEVNPERFEQELAIQLQKIDITEELDRLDAHVIEFNRVLELNEPVGRRLDFLVQELNRESNTIGSKSASISTSNASIDLKVIIEQIREQIQNIE